MRLSDIKIDGFGVWSGLELSELSEGLNVFYGPNEAGKTTLMQFLRSMFFGFSAERRASYVPPLRSSRAGGALRALAGSKTYWISRHADGPSDAEQTPWVSDGREAQQGDAALAPLLGSVDEPVFNNVFVCGLREIQELGTLDDTQAAHELYDLTLGVDRVSLADVMAELQQSRGRLLAVDDRPSLVTQLLSQRQRLQSEIEELGQSTARYFSLLSERRKVEAEITRLEAESAQWEQQARELALARALADRWRRRAEIDQQLAGLGAFGTLPEDALSRFEHANKAIQACHRRLKRLKRKRRQLRGEIDRLAINEALRRQATRLEALGEQQEWIESLADEVERLEAELAELEGKRTEQVKQSGMPEQAGAPPLSPKALAELRSAARALRQAKQDRAAVRQQRSAAEESAQSHHRRMESTLGAAGDKGLTHALAEAGERVSRLRKRVQLDERLDQMSRRQTELEEQAHEHLQRQMLPGWAVAGLGCLFVLGCALVLLYVAGLILPASLSGSLGLSVGLIGVGAAVTAAGAKIGLERVASARLSACQHQAEQLARQIEHAKKERDELDDQLPRGGGPLVARLQAAQKELSRLEELLPLESQRETASRQAEAAGEQEQSLHEEYQQHRKRWRSLAHRHGLPQNIRPHQLREFARHREHLHGVDRAIEDKRQELERRRAEYKMLARRITQLVTDVGLAPRGDRPLDQLRQCLSEWKDQQSRIKQRKELTAQIAAIRGRATKQRRREARWRARRQRLLLAAGTKDPAEFRRRALLQAESGRLAGERVQLAHDIATVVAGQISEERLAALLASPEGLERSESQLADLRRQSAEQLQLMHEKRGEMGAQLKTLLDDRQLAHKRIELSIVEKRLHDALDRWRVLAVCGHMLEAVRQYYEREHQPQALREASGYLERLTAGRYTRVWTPLGERVLKVEDRAGTSLSVDRLSRGTREQLFVALRMALVSAYTRRGVSLPLVLDDVLVNFDVGRAKAAALVLRDFARLGHQVLLFTCHEHIARLFKHVKADVRQLPDNGAPSASDGGAVSRRSRRPRAVPSEPPPAEAPADEPPAEETPVPIEIEELTEEPIAPEPVAEIEPPPAPSFVPPSPPVRQTPPRVEPRTERVRWSAEEFDGELSDRVRRDLKWDEGEQPPRAEGDDAEAA